MDAWTTYNPVHAAPNIHDQTQPTWFLKLVTTGRCACTLSARAVPSSRALHHRRRRRGKAREAPALRPCRQQAHMARPPFRVHRPPGGGGRHPCQPSSERPDNFLPLPPGGGGTPRAPAAGAGLGPAGAQHVVLSPSRARIALPPRRGGWGGGRRASPAAGGPPAPPPRWGGDPLVAEAVASYPGCSVMASKFAGGRASDRRRRRENGRGRGGGGGGSGGPRGGCRAPCSPGPMLAR